MKRAQVAAGMAVTPCTTVLALPAGAVAKPGLESSQPGVVYTYTATIDCGFGPIEVLSTDDLYAPLLDPDTGRRYNPVAWHVHVGDRVIDDVRPGKRPRRTLDCSYDDGVATGTVTIERPERTERGEHPGHGEHGGD